MTSKVDYTVLARIVGYLRTSDDNAEGLEQLLTNLGVLQNPKIIQVLLVFVCLFVCLFVHVLIHTMFDFWRTVCSPRECDVKYFVMF